MFGAWRQQLMDKVGVQLLQMMPCQNVKDIKPYVLLFGGLFVFTFYYFYLTGDYPPGMQ